MDKSCVFTINTKPQVPCLRFTPSTVFEYLTYLYKQQIYNTLQHIKNAAMQIVSGGIKVGDRQLPY